MTIRVQINCQEYTIKEGKRYPSLNTIRLIIPKNWNCKSVKLIEMNESYDLSIEGDMKFFDFELVGDVLTRDVNIDSHKGTQYVYIPLKYEGSHMLIIPL